MPQRAASGLVLSARLALRRTQQQEGGWCAVGRHAVRGRRIHSRRQVLSRSGLGKRGGCLRWDQHLLARARRRAAPVKLGQTRWRKAVQAKAGQPGA